MIESAGASRGLTANFCRVVFLGETAQAQIINEEGQTTPKAVAQSRQEVINHAGGFCYLVDQVVVKDKPMSNAIICEVHRVLATGIKTHADDVFPGEHRTHEVGVNVIGTDKGDAKEHLDIVAAGCAFSHTEDFEDRREDEESHLKLAEFVNDYS
ncbi:hypothetical protein LMH87_002821 [Akanthomyces muscarius]|uniref:Uncharacterized protein n=1 Tax=Akanthomyces muscarius TaxID=2231603 RepID=A0A9W8Q9M0_AKAMU|nr:hypothetical protein LMH87_002821 [Akanthomyces muscarius]KAJ4148346.1 hypothetical protein LMH87_002821 [Akanthomyces muscarius]